MKFYTQQHKHYCGIDLHARAMYVCILDQHGTKLVHKNLSTTPEAFLRLITPYREDLVVAVAGGSLACPPLLPDHLGPGSLAPNIGDHGPSDSALAAARGWRLRRPAADRHAARCASRDLCSGARHSAPCALECIFTWYWLADLCQQEGIAFVLGPCALYESDSRRQSQER